MKVSWEPAPGNVLQYRLTYRPSAGGPKKEMAVKADNKAALLKNLQPGTQYDILVSARYRSGPGEPLEGRGTTLVGKLGESRCGWSVAAADVAVDTYPVGLLLDMIHSGEKAAADMTS